MNGIRIRPFEAAAILAALTLLTGCSLLKFSVDTGGEPLSKEETRMRLLTRGFYYEASDEVTAAADSIAAGSDDAELQRRTIRWKLRTTRAAVDAAMQQAVAEQMSEAKPVSAQEEIEAANTVFEKYGFAFYDLAASSPKSDKTRRSCAVAVGTLLHSPVLFASMQNAHSLPIKALAQQCGVSARTLTRHRDYIVAAALLIDGDYPILCTYLQTMRKEAEQCVR